MANKYEIRRFRKFLKNHESLQLYKTNFRNRDDTRNLLDFLSKIRMLVHYNAYSGNISAKYKYTKVK